ncbi:MAG: RHS repeat-associated core domain-containing protein [Candidatus Kapaibacterium sp.]
MASAGADYRYGYNGMEEEDRGDAVSSEIASTGEKAKPGEANLLNTEFRLYDPRLGQWLTPDPVFQPWESPYSAMAGNPIVFSDPQGLNEEKPNTTTLKEVVIEADRIPGAVTPLPSVDVSQYGKNEIRDLPSTVGKDGRNYTNVNGQEVRYVPYAGGETRDFEYSFTLDGVKMWKDFAPLSNGEANARRLRTRLNAIDDFRNITTAALLTPFLLTGIGELAFSYEIGSIGLATRAAAYSTGGALASNPNTRQVIANQSSNLVQWAQSLQGNQYYPGVDQFREITLKAGTQVVGGARADGSTGQFFTTINGALRSGLTMSGYQNGVQIRYAYSELQVYEVVQTTQAAFGLSLANPNVTNPPSIGGLPQIVIQNGATVLRPLYKVILDP